MALSRRTNDIFDNFFEAMPLVRMSSSDWPASMRTGLSMDMVEKADRFVAHVDVPGVNKEDVHINVEDGILTVSADYKRENVQKGDGDRVHWVERSSGHVSRSVKLPENVEAESIKASQKDGVLEIIIPKPAAAEKKKTHQVSIE